MKRFIAKYLILLGGLLALVPISGCKLDDPVIPTEEIYIRNFIKKYGLIDPTQDFSSAKQVNVTLNLHEDAGLVNIYARVGDDYYRVGCFANLSGTVTLPVDVSEATETVLVDIDGVRYYTEPNGTVDVISGGTSARSRSVPGEDIKNLIPLWIDNWDAVTKYNDETSAFYTTTGKARNKIEISTDGSITNMDYFNVKECAYIGKNLEKEKFDKIQGDKFTKLGEKDGSTDKNIQSGAWCYNEEEIGNTHLGTNVHFRIVNNDHKLSAYKFTFRTASRNNADVRVVILGKYTTEDEGGSAVHVFMDSKNLKVKSNYKGTGVDDLGTYDTNKKRKDNNQELYTEWELRTDVMPKGEYQLIIIGMDSEENTVTNQNYCGNWGFMKLERLRTATDMKWLLACEDLGTTDDFDFNDVVFSIEAVNINQAALNIGVAQWQVIEIPNEDGFMLHPTNTTSQNKVQSRADETNSVIKTQVKVTALAAGGTLPIWLHYREEGGTDYLVCPGNPDNPLQEAATIAETEVANDKANSGIGEKCNEWHRWFNGRYKSSEMLNTGYEKHSDGKSVVFYTEKPFSLENFCYIQYALKEGKGYKPLEGNQDPWAEKVHEWLWLQENSQSVTYGFFLTVYHPLIGEENKGSKGHILSKTTNGLPPQMFLIPDCNPMRESGYESEYGWKWPCERVDITSVYPRFKEWVNNKDSYAGSNWFMLPNAGIVDKDYKLYPRDPKKQENFEWNGDNETPSFNN